MTFKEWMIINKPEDVDDNCNGGVCSCPCNYGIDSEKESRKNCTRNGGKGCEYCWNREMPEPSNQNGAFTKSDLKDGMVVEYRNGRRRILVNDFLMGLHGCSSLVNYTDDLLYKSVYNEELDICVVYKIKKTCSMNEALTENYGVKEIWRRGIVKLTPQEAADKLHELTGDTYEIKEN